MQLSDEDRARQQMQLRPTLPKPSLEEKKRELEKKQTPHPLDDLKMSPEERARKAMGLEPEMPTPQPSDLDPQLARALEHLDPRVRQQVMAVMGSIQHFQEKTQALTQQVQQRMGSALERTRQVSFSQRAIIRRAHHGALGQQDLSRADGIIQTAGDAGALDPKSLGLQALYQQREELLGAAQDIRQVLVGLIPHAVQQGADDQAGALALVDKSLGEQAFDATQTVNTAFSHYRKSDMERIATILEGQRAVDEAPARPVVYQTSLLGGR